MDKTVLLASFLSPERLEWFLDYLETKFKITKKQVFVYKNLDDESKLIVTFKLQLIEGKKLNFKSLFPNPILIHKRGDAIYTINALNKLIETKNESLIGNIDYKSITINWDEYQNKLILVNNDVLTLFSIKRIF